MEILTVDFVLMFDGADGVLQDFNQRSEVGGGDGVIAGQGDEGISSFAAGAELKFIFADQPIPQPAASGSVEADSYQVPAAGVATAQDSEVFSLVGHLFLGFGFLVKTSAGSFTMRLPGGTWAGLIM